MTWKSALAKRWKALAALVIPLLVPIVTQAVAQLGPRWTALLTAALTAFGVHAVPNAAD